MGSRAGLEAVVKRKICISCYKFRHVYLLRLQADMALHSSGDKDYFVCIVSLGVEPINPLTSRFNFRSSFRSVALYLYTSLSWNRNLLLLRNW